jgi:hypothetical protein
VVIVLNTSWKYRQDGVSPSSSARQGLIVVAAGAVLLGASSIAQEALEVQAAQLNDALCDCVLWSLVDAWTARQQSQ